MFLLRKLKSFHIDSYILQLFYKSVLQSILSFNLNFVFGNMHTQDQAKLHLMIKMVSRVIGCDHLLLPNRVKILFWSKSELIMTLITPYTATSSLVIEAMQGNCNGK